MARAALSSTLSQARGRVGNDLIVKTRGGWAVRPRPKYKQFPHPEAAAARARLRQAVDAWYSLDLPQVEAWRAYARTVRKTDSLTGEHYSPIAYNVFVGLTTRFLQATPGGEIPLWPPTTDFPGDDVVLEVEAIAGGVRFTASGPNTPGVTTELMVQKLPNIRRSPTKFYKSAAFHAFIPESPQAELELDPGVYCFAYRFVHVQDGQSTGAQVMGAVIQTNY
ncbi:MAG TPA: hypothetical protein VEX38_01125 [Fimbriimonadaceae bacterium]|nr:hypothetical protein [Fimbriimonadaceae bacterium]